MNQRNRMLIGFGLLIVIAGALLGVNYLQRQTATNSQGGSGAIPPGSIPIYMNGNLVGSFAPADLDQLSKMSFVEAEEGKKQEGWLLRDVLLLHVQVDEFQPDTRITVASASRKKSAQLSWSEVDDQANMVMFDLTGKGALKLVSILDRLDTRDDWVQDVDRIEIVSP